MLSLIIQLIAGVIGGNSAGAALKQYSLGPIGNSIVGLLGGIGGGQLLGAIVPALGQRQRALRRRAEEWTLGRCSANLWVAE